MKYLALITYGLIVGALFLMYQPAYGREAVVAIAPDGTPAAKLAEIEHLAHHLLETVDPGERAVVLNGKTLAPIGTFSVPQGAAYENKRAKARANAAFFRALKAFAEGAQTGAGTTGLVDLPGVLRHVGDYHPVDGATDLIVLGVPLHDDPKQPSLSMAGGAVPNDGHITSDPARSPYGTAGRTERLKDYRVLIGLPNKDWAVHDTHAEAIKRWAGLSVIHQGGVLAAFTDPATVYTLAGREGPGLDITPLAPTDKLEMIAFAPDRGDLPAIYDREITTAAPSATTVKFAEGTEIGIAWDCPSCDVDLWVLPHPDAEPIYFGNPRTVEGQLFKDYQRSPSITNGYETIAFRAPINLTKLKIALNFYRGKVGPEGMAGEIRIAIGARTWAAPFRITAAQGNGGNGAEVALTGSKAPNAQWVLIDPLQVIGQR